MNNLDIEKAIRDYLPDVIHMSLGTSKDNRPWVSEVHFSYDEDLNLYFRSRPTVRHSQEIAENPNVAGNIVRQHDIGEMPRGVYFEGTAQMITDNDEVQAAAKIVMDRQKVSSKIIDEAKTESGPKFYQIRVSKWYMFGKYGDAPVQKYELEWPKAG